MKAWMLAGRGAYSNERPFHLLVAAGYPRNLVRCFNEVTISGEISLVRSVLFVATDCFAASHFTHVSQFEREGKSRSL